MRNIFILLIVMFSSKDTYAQNIDTLKVYQFIGIQKNDSSLCKLIVKNKAKQITYEQYIDVKTGNRSSIGSLKKWNFYKNGNLIKSTTFSKSNKDSISTYFYYDNSSRLIKTEQKFPKKGSTVHSQNGPTAWSIVKKYTYKNGRLDKIEWLHNGIHLTTTETYNYSSENKYTVTRKYSGMYSHKKDGDKTVFESDSNGLIIKKTELSYKGDVDLIQTSIYDNSKRLILETYKGRYDEEGAVHKYINP